MTGETEAKTKPWVEKHGVEYAFGYLTKDALSPWMEALGMRGYPSAALVDPKGTVVWTGHPASVTGSLIEKHLKGVDKTPVDVRAVVRSWPKEATHARSAFVAGKLSKALEIGRGLPAEWGVADAVQRVIDKRTARLRACRDDGDLLAFADGVKAAGRSLAGMPVLAELQAELKELQKDPANKKVISGQKKLQKLAKGVAGLEKQKGRRQLVGKLRKLAKKYSGTFVAMQANKLIAKIEQRRESLR